MAKITKDKNVQGSDTTGGAISAEAGTIKAIFRGSAHARFQHNNEEYVLVPGMEHELPASSEYVQSLLLQTILQTTNIK